MNGYRPLRQRLLTAESNTNLGHQSLCLELAPDATVKHLTCLRLRGVIEESLHRAPSLRRRIRHVPLESTTRGGSRTHTSTSTITSATSPFPVPLGPGRARATACAPPPAPPRPEPSAVGALPDQGETRWRDNLFVKVAYRVDRGSLARWVRCRPSSPGRHPRLRQRRDRWRTRHAADRLDLLGVEQSFRDRSPTSPMPVVHLLQAWRRRSPSSAISHDWRSRPRGPPFTRSRARQIGPSTRVSFNRTVGAHRHVARVTLSVDRLEEVRSTSRTCRCSTTSC